MNGTLDVAGIVYYVTIIALLLFLTGQSVQKRRWSISSKKISTGVFSTGMIIAMVAVTVVVNLFVAELPATWTSIDVTSTKIYSITDDTKDYLKGLDEDVTIYVLVSDASKDTKLDETLQRYESLSDHIKVSLYQSGCKPGFCSTVYRQFCDFQQHDRCEQRKDPESLITMMCIPIVMITAVIPEALMDMMQRDSLQVRFSM